jgi:hypothetical protein
MFRECRCDAPDWVGQGHISKLTGVRNQYISFQPFSLGGF